jgi:hypothetical protein
MNESISEFHLDELSEKAFDAFTELGRQMSSRRQTPSSARICHKKVILAAMNVIGSPRKKGFGCC